MRRQHVQAGWEKRFAVSIKAIDKTENNHKCGSVYCNIKKSRFFFPATRISFSHEIFIKSLYRIPGTFFRSEAPSKDKRENTVTLP